MPETELQGITAPPESGIPNRKKTLPSTRLSCKTDYYPDANQSKISEPSRFFTGDYIECVNAAFGIAIKEADLPVDGSDMITKRVETVLVQRYGHKELDKRRVMAEILKRFDSWEKVSDLPKGTAARAEKLFGAINTAFGGVPK